MKPFPTDPAQRKAAHAAMMKAAPGLMADIAALRAQFPGARLVNFEAPGLSLGRPSNTNGWVIPEHLGRPPIDFEKVEADRKEKARQQKAKTARGKKK